MGKVQILNAKINDLSMSEAVLHIERLIREGVPSYVVTPNVDHVVKLRKDPEFKRVYDGASLALADGMPILWASRFLGTPLKQKISGSDLFPALCEIASHKGYRVFLLGGREGVAEKAARVLSAQFPSLNIVGYYSPPFGFENNENENRAIVERILSSKPHILFVGLGAPKQEKWIHRFRNEYRTPVSIGVGISFEFAAGTIRRAPRWAQRSGFEWLWRLLKEPRRLWKRYLWDDPIFFKLILAQKIQASRERTRSSKQEKADR